MEHLTGIAELSGAEIIELLDRAADAKKRLLARKKTETLKGRSVAMLFYENSTRTKLSFEEAAKYLGADVYGLAVASSSVQKGESLVDTGRTLDALQTDIVVIRHSLSGVPIFLKKHVSASIVNAGDGMREHPTQALLDFLTMRERFGDFRGLNVTILGDVRHSRVARSNIIGLSRLGANVTVSGPGTLVPQEIAALSCQIEPDMTESVRRADVIMGLRLQTERQQSALIPSLQEYNKIYGITEELLKNNARGAVILHPGPVNRDVELAHGLVEAERSLIHTQVTNGVAVRMAVLEQIAESRFS